MNTVELLLEIGLEEVPARFLPEAERNLREMTAKRLAELDLSCESVRVFSTPRRLTLVVDGLAAGQPDREVEKTGPSKKAAYDEQGKPTKAALGFAKGQGVEVEDLQIFTTDKGEYLGVRKTIAGKPAAELLPGAPDRNSGGPALAQIDALGRGRRAFRPPDSLAAGLAERSGPESPPGRRRFGQPHLRPSLPGAGRHRRARLRRLSNQTDRRQGRARSG
jgi:hypothetical protein